MSLDTKERKFIVDPNPDRHYIRSLLAEKRRECYRVTFGVKKMRERGVVPRPEKLNLLRSLRKECKRLSKLLRTSAPYVYIRNKEETWLDGRGFEHFRHTSRAVKWSKDFRIRGWQLRTTKDSSNAP